MKFGWAIQTTRCAHLDAAADSEVYCVNLVTPWCDDSQPGTRGPLATLAGIATASEQDVFFPWTWNDVQWHVFTATAATGQWTRLGTWQMVPGTPPSPVGPALLHALRGEIATKVSHCDYLFSIHPDDTVKAGANSSSLPHAIAPLSHWPAGMSNAALALAGFLELPIADLDAAGATHLVCVPELRLAADAAARVPAPDTAHASNTRFIYDTTDTLMVSRACARSGGLDLTPGLPPPAADAGPGLPLLRSYAASELHPLAILMAFARQALALSTPEDAAFIDTFGANLALRAAWTDVLHAFIPDGWGPAYKAALDPARRDHVLARLGMADELAQQLPANPARSSSVLRDTLASLAARKLAPSWSDTDILYWEQVQSNYADLALASAGAHFLRTWLEVAHAIANPLSARHLMGPWLARLYGVTGPLAAQLGASVLFTDALELASVGMLTAHSAPAIRDLLNNHSAPLPDAAAVAAGLLDFTLQHRLGDLVAGHGQHQAKFTLLAGDFLLRLASRADPATPVPRDPGLLLQFEQDMPHPDFDQSVRGYALALCSYLPGVGGAWLADTSRAGWLTDTAMLSRLGGAVQWIAEAGPGNGLWWLHDTVGSTLQNGLRTTRVSYEGRPVTSMLADARGKIADAENVQVDGADCLDFLWPARAALPLLGYGMHYGALCTCLDNAGGVADAALRGDGYARLKRAPELFGAATVPQWHYRSAVPPGAPVPVAASGPARAVPDEAYQWSQDTRAHAHAAWSGRDPHPATDAPTVALLIHQQAPAIFRNDALASKLGPYQIAFAAPAADTAFVERWLNTDIVLLEAAGSALGALSDPVFAQGTPAQLAAFKTAMAAAAPAYHPAVAALGVALWFDEAPAPARMHVHPLERVRYDAAGGKFSALRSQFDIRIEAGAANTAPAPATGSASMHVSVAPGSYVRIRVFALVEERYFTGADAQRFHAGISAPAGPFAPAFPRYRAFGPAEQFFETAPAWHTGTRAAVTLAMQVPGTHKDGQLVQDHAVVLDCAMTGKPDWIRGLYVQRHEWHWTGYPVRLPKGDALTDWLTSLEGIESYREASEAVLPTAFPAAGWAYGVNGDGLAPVATKALPSGTRPARYAAFAARPILRFRSLLDDKAADGPLALEREVFAVGAVVPGIGPQSWNERLPTPPLRWAVPLTSTCMANESLPYNAGPTESQVRRIANGNLLIFDDALRRTDQLSRIGGIGDTLEIDLLETRDSAYREIGCNPIFHANRTPAGHQALRLDVHPPFGLTQDIGANPLVRQTAVVVRPVGGAGQWLLAKIRARRMILPETLLGSLYEANDPRFPVRSEGDDSLPVDFALDFASEPAPDGNALVTLHTADHGELKSAWPVLPADDAGRPLRLLCSWHKERWAGGDAPAWRMQVLVQRRSAGELAWSTVGKLSGFDNPDSTLAAGVRLGGISLRPTAQGRPQVQLVRMSDYTDPMWLSFIGAFGCETLGLPDQYKLDGDMQSLVLRSLAASAIMPELKGIDGNDTCFQILLLYRPLVDVTRGDDRSDTGALVGAFCYSQAANSFVRLPSQMHDDVSRTEADGCFAYLCSVQRITSPSAQENVGVLRNFDELIQKLFNDDVDQESVMRLLPEFIGPIAAGTPG